MKWMAPESLAYNMYNTSTDVSVLYVLIIKILLLSSLMLQTIRFNVFKSCWRHRYVKLIILMHLCGNVFDLPSKISHISIAKDRSLCMPVCHIRSYA